VILEAIRDVPGFVGEPAPIVVFQTFNGSTMDVSAFFWYDTGITNPFAAKDVALERIKAALEKHGIELPLPFPTIYAQNTEK
jgi:small-conductance mechanosensitive channel